MRLKTCVNCGQVFNPDLDDEGFVVSEKLCYHCFEDSVDAFEERRRERIAISNEY